MSDVQANPPVEYRPIPGFPGYRVGSDGSIWSCRLHGQHYGKTGIWKLLKPAISRRNGYANTSVVSDQGKSVTKRLHRLILAAFRGPCPDGHEGCHCNGIKADNRLVNLRWDTPKNNHADKAVHGTKLLGSAVNHAKLDETKVAEIKRRIIRGDTGVDAMGREFGVSSQTIKDIRSGKTWSHIHVEIQEEPAP